MIHLKHKTHALTLNHSATPFMGTVSIALNEVFSANELNVLEAFTHYKLNAVKVEFIPKQNAVGSTYFSNQETPPAVSKGVIADNIVTCFVNNRDLAFSDYKDLMRMQNHKVHRFNSYIKRYTKVRPQVDLSMGETSASVVMRRNVWMSTRDNDVVFGRLMYSAIREGETPACAKITQFYDIHVTMYISLKRFMGLAPASSRLPCTYTRAFTVKDEDVEVEQ